MDLNNSTSLDFTPYCRYDGGVIVHCWQIDLDVWRCGLIDARPQTIFPTFMEARHMQNDLPCELSKMSEILKTYYSPNRIIGVYEINYPYDELGIISENNPYLLEQLGLSSDFYIEK